MSSWKPRAADNMDLSPKEFREARLKAGLDRYGENLLERPESNRDSLLEAYEEAGDLVNYLHLSRVDHEDIQSEIRVAFMDGLETGMERLWGIIHKHVEIEKYQTEGETE